MSTSLKEIVSSFFLVELFKGMALTGRHFLAFGNVQSIDNPGRPRALLPARRHAQPRPLRRQLRRRPRHRFGHAIGLREGKDKGHRAQKHRGAGR